MRLAQSSRYSDPFGRYYTNEGVAELLVSSMGSGPSGVVIDLGAGDGALVGEASRHWKTARFITVDIDRNAACSRLRDLPSAIVSHHVADALDHRLDQKIGLATGSAHTALCNPPYIKPKWRKHFGHILEEAGLSGVYPRIRLMSQEVV